MPGSVEFLYRGLPEDLTTPAPDPLVEAVPVFSFSVDKINAENTREAVGPASWT